MKRVLGAVVVFGILIGIGIGVALEKHFAGPNICLIPKDKVL